ISHDCGLLRRLCLCRLSAILTRAAPRTSTFSGFPDSIRTRDAFTSRARSHTLAALAGRHWRLVVECSCFNACFSDQSPRREPGGVRRILGGQWAMGENSSPIEDGVGVVFLPLACCLTCEPLTRLARDFVARSSTSPQRGEVQRHGQRFALSM